MGRSKTRRRVMPPKPRTALKRARVEKVPTEFDCLFCNESDKPLRVRLTADGQNIVVLCRYCSPIQFAAKYAHLGARDRPKPTERELAIYTAPNPHAGNTHAAALFSPVDFYNAYVDECAAVNSVEEEEGKKNSQ